MQTLWFQHPEWWFGSQYDDEITHTFQHLLDDVPSEPLNLILIYDQLPRHMFRGQPCNHIISYFLQKALHVNICYEDLNDQELCFALLPYRHTLVYENCLYAINICWKRVKEKGMTNILKRFLKASYDRIPLSNAKPTYGLLTYNSAILDHNPMYEPVVINCLKFENIQSSNIVVSLSGGVDSMLCSWVLANQFHDVVAIHINYNNRETSDDEERFVTSWCHKIGIPLFVRKFDEIQRESCMKHGLRETYETYTRDVRYFCYKMFGNDAHIVLGHNKDDVLENIFTNIACKTKYENLDGMLEHSVQDNIRFWRPLIHIEKAKIIDICKIHNIPFLHNSTPTWSQRGQIRNKIVPVIDSWNSSFLPGLHSLSSVTRDLYMMMVDVVDEILQTYNNSTWFMKKIRSEHMFWRCLFQKISLNTISSSAIKNLCSRLQNPQQHMLINLNKYTFLRLTNCDNIWQCEVIRRAENGFSSV